MKIHLVHSRSISDKQEDSSDEEAEEGEVEDESAQVM